MLNSPCEEQAKNSQSDENKKPVWAEDASRDLELPSERPPWLAGELRRLPVVSTQPASTAAAASSAIVGIVLLWPDGIPIPIGPFGLKQPAVVIPVAGLAPCHGLLRPHNRQPPLHPGRGSAAGRRGQGERGPGTAVGGADQVVHLGGLVGLLAAGAEGAGVLDGVAEALGADLEAPLAWQDVLATLVAHDLGVAAVDGAGGALGAGHLRVERCTLDLGRVCISEEEPLETARRSR